MGLNLLIYRKPKDVVMIDTSTEYSKSLTFFGPDEKLLDIFTKLGTSVGEYITFNEEQFRKLVTLCQSIDDGTAEEKADYTKRYSNETMLEFYQRWNRIINGLKTVLYRLDWDTEHVLVYVSA